MICVEKSQLSDVEENGNQAIVTLIEPWYNNRKAVIILEFQVLFLAPDEATEKADT